MMRETENVEKDSALTNPFDRDMAEVDKMDPLDRGRQALETYREAVGVQVSPFYGQASRGGRLRTNTPEWGEHYMLPTVQGQGFGNVRLSEDEHSSYNRTPGHVFLNVEQETMWQLESAAAPVAYASMSECSALIGRSESSLWVAHVGYSTKVSLAAAAETMKAAGVTIDSMMAVAATGKLSPSAVFGAPATRQDYLDLGIQPERIVEYDYSQQTDVEGTTQGHNLAQVVARPNEVYVATSDYTRKPMVGGILPPVTFANDPTMERVVTL